MNKGRTYSDTLLHYHDPKSGREIVRLTDYLGHSNHLYFTDPCWVRDNESLVFTSDRENQSNLFRYDLSDGTICQLTDLTGAGRPCGCYSQVNGAHYFWWHGELIELDIETLKERVIAREPAGMIAQGHANPTADGRYVCTCFMERPETSGPQIEYAYAHFREFFHAQPFTQIVRVDLATGDVDVIHEDRCFIGHINVSPVLPDVMTFCHEGPWQLVGQRIWGLNIQTGDVWKIRDQAGDNIAIGHEYWFADGERIGYHGYPRDRDGDHVFGWIRWDASEHREVSFPFESMHFHSLDEVMIVGDGTRPFVSANKGPALPYIQLFKWDGERYVGPRVLAYHRSTFNDQYAHPHPRFTPNGKSILYSSDLTSYANMYLVDIGDFESLPPVEQAD